MDGMFIYIKITEQKSTHCQSYYIFQGRYVHMYMYVNMPDGFMKITITHQQCIVNVNSKHRTSHEVYLKLL